MRACFDLLRRTEVGHFAVVIADHPEIFPVNFVVDHGSVLFRTAEGTKLAAVAFGGNVAFQADGYDVESGEAWSVVVKGRATEVRNVQERLAAAALPLFPWQAAPKPRFVRIVPVEVTGRRFRVVDRPVAAQPPKLAAPE